MRNGKRVTAAELKEELSALEHEIPCCAWCGREIKADHFRVLVEDFYYRYHETCYGLMCALTKK
jgi:hypothetical protein